MNYKLEELIKNTPVLTKKDIYEIKQMFEIFDTSQKIKMLENWDSMINKILKLKESIKKQQEILLGKAIDNIEKQIINAKKNGYRKGSGENLNNLKSTI